MAILQTILHYLALPASTFNHAFSLPDSLAFSRFLLANVFAVSILTIACWAFLVWRRSKYYYYLMLYFVLVITALVGYQATLSLQYAWVYSLLLAVAGFFFVFFSQISHRFPPFTRKMLRRFYVFGIIIALCLPLIFSWRYQTNKQNVEKQSLNDIAVLENHLKVQQNILTNVANTLAEDKNVKDLISNQNLPKESALNALATDNKVGFIAITDPLANLLGRSFYTSNTSINYFEKNAWGYNLFFLKEPIDSLVEDSTQIPTLISGRPIFSENRSLIGFLLIGQPLENTYIKNLSTKGDLGLLTDKGVAFAKTTQNDLGLMVNLANFNQEITRSFNQYGTTSGNVASSIIQFKGKHYLITGRQQSTIERDKLFYIFSIKENKDFSVFSIIDILSVIALSFIIVLIMSLTKRYFLKLWSYPGDKSSKTAKDNSSTTSSTDSQNTQGAQNVPATPDTQEAPSDSLKRTDIFSGKSE